MTEPLRLHLGCGDVHLGDGWTNIDYRYQPGVDRVDNIGILKRYSPESVDAIYASHCLDHFSRWEYHRVLRRWHELLKPDGVLCLSVVDFDAVVRFYMAGVPLERLTGLLVAAQDYDGNIRHMHWNLPLLTHDLTQAGFTGGVRRVSIENWPFTTDCSTWKVDGEIFSINIETRKPCSVNAQ